MPTQARKEKDHRSLSSSFEKSGSQIKNGPATLRPTRGADGLTAEPKSLVQYSDDELASSPNSVFAEVPAEHQARWTSSVSDGFETTTDTPTGRKEKKRAMQAAKDHALLGTDRWFARNGHFLTFIGLYLFSIMVLFRPYELIGGL